MEKKKLTINKWAEEDRPREKLMNLGAEALSNAELLADRLWLAARKCRRTNEACLGRLRKQP